MPNAANPFYQDPFGAPEAEMYEPVTKEQARKNRKAFARGISYIPQDLLGAGVDFASLPFLAYDMFTGNKYFSKPVGGSDWLIDQSRRLAPNIVPEPTGEGWELGGRIAGGLVNPAGVVRGAAKTPRALADLAEAGSTAATRRITGNPNLTMEDIYRAMGEQQKPVSGIIKEKGGNWLGKEDFVQGLRQDQDKTELKDLWDLNATDIQKMERLQLQGQLMDDKILGKMQNRAYSLARDDVKPKQEYINQVKEQFPEIKDRDVILSRANVLEYNTIQQQISDITNKAWRESSDAVSAKYGLPTLDELDQPRQIYNQWVEKPLTKYITNTFGTAEDPLRKLADEGIDKWINRDMLGEPPNRYVGKAREAQGFPAEGLAKTPLSRLFEDEADYYLHHGTFKASDIRDPESDQFGWTKSNPWIGNLPGDTPLYMLDENPPEFVERLGKEVKKLAQEGRIKPDQVAKWTPDSIARSAHERALADEALEAQDLGAMKEWARARKETIPTLMKFDDGDSIAIMSKDMDPEDLKRDLSLQTCLLNHCVGSAGHDAGKYIPMVMPHTGKPPPKAKEGLGTSYYDDILEGNTEIHSLLDKDGIPRMTAELEFSEWDRWEINQIKGMDNGIPDKKYQQKIAQYIQKLDEETNGGIHFSEGGIQDLNEAGLFTYRVDTEGDVYDQIGRVLTEKQAKKFDDLVAEPYDYAYDEIASKIMDEGYITDFSTAKELWDGLKLTFPELK